MDNSSSFVGLILIPASLPLFYEMSVNTTRRFKSTKTNLAAIRPFPSSNHLFVWAKKAYYWVYSAWSTLLPAHLRFLPYFPATIRLLFRHLHWPRMEGQSYRDLVNSGKMTVICVVISNYTNSYSVLRLRANQQAVEHCFSSRHPLNQCQISQGWMAIRSLQQKERQGAMPGPQIAQ